MTRHKRWWTLFGRSIPQGHVLFRDTTRGGVTAPFARPATPPTRWDVGLLSLICDILQRGVSSYAALVSGEGRKRTPHSLDALRNPKPQHGVRHNLPEAPRVLRVAAQRAAVRGSHGDDHVQMQRVLRQCARDY